MMSNFSNRYKNAIIELFTLISKYASRVFIFRPERAAWYLKAAIRYWKCEQPSRPFS